MKRPVIIEIISCLLIALFVYAAVAKIMDMQQFQIQLGKSPLLTSFSTLVSFAVPAIEVIISLTLVLPRFRLFGLYASFSLMLLFTLYIIAILHLDKNIPCSCGGILEKMGWKEHLVFNSVFTLIAIVAVLIYPGTHSKNSMIYEKYLPAGK